MHPCIQKSFRNTLDASATPTIHIPTLSYYRSYLTLVIFFQTSPVAIITIHSVQNRKADSTTHPSVSTMFNKLSGQPESYEKKYCSLYASRPGVLISGTDRGIKWAKRSVQALMAL